MANVLAELFQNTADAIREKTGETGTMKPAEFPEKIRGITTGGSADVCPLSYTQIENPETVPAYLCNNFTFSPDGTKLLLVHCGGVYIYDTQTEPYTYIETLEGSDTSVPWSACYSADGTRLILVMGGTDSTKVTIKTYDTTVSPYALISGLIPATYTSNTYFGQGRWSALSPNGEILCITGEKGFLAFDTTTTPYELLVTKTGVSQANPPVFSEDGTSLYLTSRGTLHTVTYTSTISANFCNIKYTIAEDRTMTLSTNTGFKNDETLAVFFGNIGKVSVTQDGAQINQYEENASSPYRALYMKELPWDWLVSDASGNYLISGGSSAEGLRLTEFCENGMFCYNLTEGYTKKTRMIGVSSDKNIIFVATTDSADPLYIFRKDG